MGGKGRKRINRTTRSL